MAKVVGIKFNSNPKVYYFEPDQEYKVGDSVVVSSDNGSELATIAVANTEIEDSKLVFPLAKVVRKATDKDIAKINELKKSKSDIITKATELTKKYKLDIKVVDVDFTLDNNKVTVYFVCEDRVDFREYVKDLAGAIKARVELRQIGIRDHAKRLGGIGPCGQECCCTRFLNDFEKVSVKMAKTQNLSLNPTKISGACGRLMCCLSYENEYYAQVGLKMPKINSYVSTPKGNGVVVYNDLLRELVSVKREVGEGVVVEQYEPNQIKILSKDNNGKKEFDKTN